MSGIRRFFIPVYYSMIQLHCRRQRRAPLSLSDERRPITPHYISIAEPDQYGGSSQIGGAYLHLYANDDAEMLSHNVPRQLMA